MNKTNKSLKGRIKLTKGGKKGCKVIFRKPGKGHLRRKKKTKTLRAMGQDQVLSDAMGKRFKQALPHG